jgi:hypothetical protein
MGITCLFIPWNVLVPMTLKNVLHALQKKNSKLSQFMHIMSNMTHSNYVCVYNEEINGAGW